MSVPKAKTQLKNQAKLQVLEGAGRSPAADKFRVLFDEASDAIMTFSADGKWDEVNLAFQELSGYVAEEVFGKTVEALMPDSDRQHIPLRSRPLTLEMLSHPGTYEDVAILRKDGYIRLVDLSVRSVSKGPKGLTLALMRDITERKRMERELITKHTELRNAFSQIEKANLELKAAQDTLVQAGKMAALGELAAGIAHEINQPLMGIRGYAQEVQALAATEGNHQAVQFGLKEIISNADKMSKIIKYLRTFTRKSIEGYEEVDVHLALEESLKMLDRQFSSRGIRVIKNSPKEPMRIFANPVQLEQVFINLATNARDAIEATGRGQGLIEVTMKGEKDFVEIRFKDDGIGMDIKTQSKIFNPFFTTKEVGKGMGLGLSLSYGILNKIQGSILVESEPGKGTEFVIRIPRDFRELG